jgi:hypothetical protein
LNNYQSSPSTEKILRELQSLKIFEIQNETKQRTEEPQVPSEEVERRLVNEAIDEVVGIENDQSDDDLNYSWVDQDLEERMRRNNLWIWSENSKRTSPSIADRIQSAVALSPSLNRDQLEVQELNLVECHQSDINQMFQTDDLPEATNEVLAGMGIFETSIGRRLFNKVNGIETPQLRQSDVREVIQASASVPADFPATSHFPPPIDDDFEVMNPVEVPGVASEVRKSLRLSSALQKTTKPSVLEVEAPRRSSDVVLGDIGNEMDQLAKEAAERMKNAPKLRRPRRKPAIAQPSDIDGCHKTLKNFKSKALVYRDIIVLLHFEVNFDYSQYQDDKVPKEKPQAMARESLAEIIGLDTVPAPCREVESSMPRNLMISPARDHLTSTPLARDIDIASNHNTLLNSRNSEVSQAKRPRIDLSAGANFEPPELDIVHPEVLVPPQQTPHITVRKNRFEAAGQGFNNKTPTVIDATDMEFANLQHKSMSSQPITLQDDRPSRKIGNEDEFDENGRHLFRRVKGKYDTMIEFVGSDGKIKSRSNYSMEVS